MFFRIGIGDIVICYSLWILIEFFVLWDLVGLVFQDSQVSNILVMDYMIMILEMFIMELEGGFDDSGEYFFDVCEVYSDENLLEGDGVVNKEEKDVNLCILGNYLIFDGYDLVQESFIDEEVVFLFILQFMIGIFVVEFIYQQ